MRKVLYLTGLMIVSGAAFAVPEIQVDPLEHDFGLMEVGSSASVLITVNNLGDTTLALNDVYFESGSRDFAITSFLLLPLFMSPGAQFSIEVTFAPTSGGAASASLLIISTDADEPEVRVLLAGQAPSEEQTPEEQIADIIDFTMQSASDGTLVGDGPGKSAVNRLQALQNMLDQAQDLIDEGMYEEARVKLESIYKKIDGQDKPDDFAAGSAAEALAEMILELLEALDSIE